MTYVEILPCEALRPYINCYWHFEGESGAQVVDRTFPDGSMEIVFNIQTHVFTSRGNSNFTRNPASELIGQMTQPYEVQFRGLNRFLGVRFFPHTFSCFTDERLIDFNDQSIDPRDALGREFTTIAEMVQSEEEKEVAIRIIEHSFLRKLKGRGLDSKHLLLDFAVRRIFLGQVNTINDLQRDTGCNERFLQRLFSERVGINPKFLLKIARFQRSLRFLNDGSLSLTVIAYECGYFDQAHFNRDFRYFTASSPSEYLNNQYPINQFFLAENTNSYLYGMNRKSRSEADVAR